MDTCNIPNSGLDLFRPVVAILLSASPAQSSPPVNGRVLCRLCGTEHPRFDRIHYLQCVLSLFAGCAGPVWSKASRGRQTDRPMERFPLRPTWCPGMLFDWQPLPLCELLEVSIENKTSEYIGSRDNWGLYRGGGLGHPVRLGFGVVEMD